MEYGMGYQIPEQGGFFPTWGGTPGAVPSGQPGGGVVDWRTWQAQAAARGYGVYPPPHLDNTPYQPPELVPQVAFHEREVITPTPYYFQQPQAPFTGYPPPPPDVAFTELETSRMYEYDLDYYQEVPYEITPDTSPDLLDFSPERISSDFDYVFNTLVQTVNHAENCSLNLQRSHTMLNDLASDILDYTSPLGSYIRYFADSIDDGEKRFQIAIDKEDIKLDIAI